MRGFFSFLQTRKPPDVLWWVVTHVSIPLRGFFSFLRGSGPAQLALALRINPLAGILFISTCSRRNLKRWMLSSINPLAGILFISTNLQRARRVQSAKYQSPCGDSFHFYHKILHEAQMLADEWYQSPCGDSFHFYEGAMGWSSNRGEPVVVSIPLRGFFSFLLIPCLRSTRFRISSYQSPCGDSFHFYLATE